MDARIRADFPVTQDMAYLDTAYSAPCPLPVIRAGQAFLERRSRGVAGRVDTWCAFADGVRPLAGRLLNASPDEVAFLTNTSEGVTSSPPRSIGAPATMWCAMTSIIRPT